MPLKEDNWYENQGINIQTFSNSQEWGVSRKTPELPLWAIMIAKKLYYEKVVDFIPGKVTIFEEDYNSKEVCDSLKNKTLEVSGRAITVVLEVINDKENYSKKKKNLSKSSTYIYGNKRQTLGNRMIALLFR